MAINQYQPDYAVPPGWVLEERLDAQGISPSRVRSTVRALSEVDQRDHLGKSLPRAGDSSSVRKGAGRRCAFVARH